MKRVTWIINILIICAMPIFAQNNTSLPKFTLGGLCGYHTTSESDKIKDIYGSGGAFIYGGDCSVKFSDKLYGTAQYYTWGKKGGISGNIEWADLNVSIIDLGGRYMTLPGDNVRLWYGGGYSSMTATAAFSDQNDNESATQTGFYAELGDAARIKETPVEFMLNFKFYYWTGTATVTAFSLTAGLNLAIF